MTDRTGPELLRRALEGDAAAARALVAELAPVVHARVARALVRSVAGRRQGRDARQEIEDLVQEVFAALLADRGKLLRGWDPTRGLSLPNFVGMLAEHQVASILRSGRRSPWKEEATEAASLDRTSGATEGPHRAVASRDVLAKLVERLRADLSPLGLRLFQRIVVEERSVEEICSEMGMTAEAVYAWRSRLAKRARELRDEIAPE